MSICGNTHKCKGDESLICQLQPGHQGPHQEGSLFWRNEPVKQEKKS